MTPTSVLSAVSLALALVAVSIAIACYFACRAVTARYSMSSIRAELDEMHDAFEKHSKLLKRINQRGVMQERRESNEPSSADGSERLPGEAPGAWKARMRAKLIVPGRPVRHA